MSTEPATVDGESTRIPDDEIGRNGRSIWPIRARPLTKEIFDNIIADIAAGEPAYKAAPANGINSGVFWAYLGANPDAAKDYARAREIGLERWADEMMRIAATPMIGEKRKTVEIVSGRGDAKVTLPAVEVTTGDMVEARKLHVDTIKWQLSKLASKRYGDKLAVEHSVGEDMLTSLREGRERRIGSDGAGGGE